MNQTGRKSKIKAAQSVWADLLAEVDRGDGLRSLGELLLQRGDQALRLVLFGHRWPRLPHYLNTNMSLLVSPPAHLPLVTVLLDQRGRVLHLEDGVLTEVHETLHLLLVASITDGRVEKSLLGLFDLRLFPLVQLVFVYLEVHSFNLNFILDIVFPSNFSNFHLLCRLDLDPPQEGLKVVEDGARGHQEPEAEMEEPEKLKLSQF